MAQLTIILKKFMFSINIDEIIKYFSKRSSSVLILNARYENVNEVSNGKNF